LGYAGRGGQNLCPFIRLTILRCRRAVPLRGFMMI
jgi:hypothetical protein